MADVLPTLIIFHCNGKEEKKFIEYTVRTGASPFLILFKNIYEKNLVQTLNSFTDKCSALILFSKALLDLTWRIESKEIIEEELPKITRKNVNILLDVSKQDVQRKNINVLSTGYTIDARKLFMKREPNENPRFWKKIEISLRSGDVEKDAHYHNVVEDVAMNTGSVDNCLVTTKICKGHESVSIERLEENTGFLILDKHGNKQILQCLSVCEEDKCESIDLREKSKTPDIVNIIFSYGEIAYLEKQIHDEVNEVKKTHEDFEVADPTVEYVDDAQFTDISFEEFENEGHDGIIHNHDVNPLDCSEMNDNAENRGVTKYENTYDERKNNEISDQENSDIREKIYLKSGCNINVNIVPKKSHDFVVDSKNSVVMARDLTAETWYPIIASNHLQSTTNNAKKHSRDEETIDAVQLKSVEDEGNNYIELQCCYEESAFYLNVDHTLEFYEVLEIDVGSEMTNIIERHRISDAIPLGEPLFDDDDDEEKTPVKETKAEEAKPTSTDVPYGGLFYHKTIFAF